MTSVVRLAVIVSLAAAWAACGIDSAASSCPADEPSSCPSPMPSYASDIAPLISKYCEVAGCHVPGGAAADQVLSPYSELHARRLDVLTQIYQCRMPQVPPDPTLGERVQLLGWLVCGAPDN